MLTKQIPAFVNDIVAFGCDICAVGANSYLIGDADLEEDHYELIKDDLSCLDEFYGPRDHLKFEIIAYLRSIGRAIELDTLH
ncbi:MAG: hypothetical protein ACOH2J_01120 [Allorhizobium sp.]